MPIRNNPGNVKALPVGAASAKIEEAVRAYLFKEDGKYLYSAEHRLPLYLYGPPGIGKTQTVKEIAEELGRGFVCFPLTHYTKTQLLGLPVITEREGYKYTECTRPEIIARVYEEAEKGHEEGIVLLDEFNCASDGIMPAMLEFLQFGIIGTHKLPDGWIIILCGNPPEYNKSARAFDAAIMDRVRKIELMADQEDFDAYALETGLHHIIRDFLQQNPGALYSVGEKINILVPSGKGKTSAISGFSQVHRPSNAATVNPFREKPEAEVVTPRGWENLSRTMDVYEKMGIDIDEELIYQFIKSDKTAFDFYQFYLINTKLFTKAEVEDILAGTDLEKYAEKASSKSFNFRVKLVDHLAGKLESEAQKLLNEPLGDETVSNMISHVFKFMALLPEKPLQESMLMKVNSSVNMMKVLVKVRNEEYLALCSKAYGLDGAGETA